MVNFIVLIYEWLNSYFVSFSGYLVSVIITVAFIFWGRDMFKWLEHAHQSLVKPLYQKKAPKIMRNAPHFDSFIVFLIGALIIIPAVQSLLSYLLAPLLKTTSLLVLLVIVFVVFYLYYVKSYRSRIMRN